MRKMKICLLSRFFDLRNAGIGRYSQNLCECLKKKQVRVRCVSQDGGIPLGQGRAKYLFYTTLEIPFKMPDGYHIYHACSPIEALWLGEKNSVVTFHDLIPMIHSDLLINTGIIDSISRYIGQRHFNLACKRAVKCRAIIADSQQTADDLVEHFNLKKESINVIRPGIPKNLEPVEKENGTYRIGTLSFLESRKRVDLLIKAFLEADIKHSELLIAGKGFEEQRLKKIGKGDGRIKFLEFIPDSELSDFYNSLDVFVFPSILEGYGMPMVEAMACGKPVLTLKDAIIPDDIKSHTCSVDEQDLPDILKYQDYRCDIKENLRFAREHSWEKLVEETLNVYNSVI